MSMPAQPGGGSKVSGKEVEDKAVVGGVGGQEINSGTKKQVAYLEGWLI